MNKKLVLLGATLLLTAAGASAQKRVTGRVVDAQGEPVVGATVRVEGHKVVVTTDDNGRFTLNMCLLLPNTCWSLTSVRNHSR